MFVLAFIDTILGSNPTPVIFLGEVVLPVQVTQLKCNSGFAIDGVDKFDEHILLSTKQYDTLRKIYTKHG